MRKSNYTIQKKTQSADGDKLYLYYYITECEEYENRYGVGIDMYIQKAHQRTERESELANGIFKTLSEAERFMKLLAEGYVTPITLCDIVDDNVRYFLA